MKSDVVPCPRCGHPLELKEGVSKPFYCCYGKCKDGKDNNYFTLEQVETGLLPEVKQKVRRKR